MKVSLTQENLHKGLSIVGKIVGNRSTLPVLGNVLISTESNRLRLSTTNLEIGINYWLGAKVEQEGSITVPARLLGDYVATLPNNNIELSVEKSILSLKTTNYQSTINGTSAEEFPSIPKLEKKSPLQLPAQQLKQAISQVITAASIDDARPVLSGVYLYNSPNHLITVATDSYRLAEKKIKLTPKNKSIPDDFKIIIPVRTMQEVLRITDDEQDKIELLVEDNQVLFRLANIELVSRLIDGQFPDYRQLIPREAQTQATLKTADLTAVTKTAALFAKENAGSVSLKIDPAAKSLNIRSIASQLGENISHAPAQIKGEGGEVSLNCRYLLEALSVLNQEKLTFSITGKVNPCLLRPEGDDSYLHIIMPLRS